MSKKLKPFLAHSELTDCIYIIDGNDKYEVTEQCIKAMKATNRMANVFDKIRAEIEQVKSIMNDEIINHDRKDLINFVNGLNQSLVIIDKYKGETEDKE